MKEHRSTFVARATTVLALSSLPVLSAFAPGQVKLHDEVVLRLKGVDDRPVVGKRLRVVLDTKKGHHFELLETDQYGNLTVPIPEDYAKRADGVIRILQCRFSVDDDIPDAYVAGANVPFREVHGVRRKLVTLRRPQLLLGGIVVDRQGKPLSGVHVKVGAEYGRFRSNHRDDAGQEIYELSVLTDRAGKFAIRELDSQRSRLKTELAFDGMGRVDTRRFSVGQADVKIVMGRTASLRVKIAGVPEGKRYPYPVRLVGNGLTNSGVARSSRTTRGWVQFSDCVVGTYELQVFGDYTGRKPIKTIAGVQVKEGEGALDARVTDIDVSSHVAWYHLTIKTADGRSPDRVSIGRSVSTTGTSRLAGWYQVDVKDPEFTVVADGYRTKTVTPQQQKFVVVLEKGWKLVLSVPNLPELSATEIRVVEPGVRRRVTRFRTRKPLSSATDEMELFLADPGVREVELVLALPNPDGRRAFNQRKDPNNEISLGKRKFEVKASDKTGAPLAWKIELSAAQRALVASFDKLMQERNR